MTQKTSEDYEEIKTKFNAILSHVMNRNGGQMAQNLALNLLQSHRKSGAILNVLDFCDSHGRTLLHHTAGFGCTQLALRLGTRISFGMRCVYNKSRLSQYTFYYWKLCRAVHDDTIDDTALHRAVRFNKVKEVELLLKAGSDINAKGEVGNSPLHVAVYCNALMAFNILLLHSPNVDLLNDDGYSIVEYARHPSSKGRSTAEFFNGKLADIKPQKKRKPTDETTTNVTEKQKTKKQVVSHPILTSGEFETLAGIRVRSLSEAFIANYLFSKQIQFEYEPKLVVADEDEDKLQTLRPDFYLPKHSLYIEYFGVESSESYRIKAEKKKRLFNLAGFKLLTLKIDDLKSLESTLMHKLS